MFPFLREDTHVVHAAVHWGEGIRMKPQQSKDPPFKLRHLLKVNSRLEAACQSLFSVFLRLRKLDIEKLFEIIRVKMPGCHGMAKVYKPPQTHNNGLGRNVRMPSIRALQQFINLNYQENYSTSIIKELQRL